MESKQLRAVIGLGNQGNEYENTYHNVGVLAQNFLQKRIEEEYDRPDIFWYLVQGYMNQSGTPIAKFLKDHNLSADEVLVLYDDSDLLRGEYKIAEKGSGAGHKGIADLVHALGTEEFLRVKIGVREKDEPVRKKAGDFVLKQIPKAEIALFEETFEKIYQDIRSRVGEK